MTPEEYLVHHSQEKVDTGRNRFGMTIEEVRNRAEANSFLSNIKSDLHIGSIYYPGCGQDSVLEPVFTGKVTYLDRIINRHDAGKKGLVGDFMNPPPEISNASFDAAFIKDLHLHLKETEDRLSQQEKLDSILGKIKLGGTVIYGISRNCDKWEGELAFLQSRKELLTPLHLSYANPDFRTFIVKKC